MREITLTDGQKFEVVMCGEASGILWLELPDHSLTFLNIVQTFGDAEKTSKIVHKSAFGEETVYENYTDLNLIQREYDGNIKFALRKVVVT